MRFWMPRADTKPHRRMIYFCSSTKDQKTHLKEQKMKKTSILLIILALLLVVSTAIGDQNTISESNSKCEELSISVFDPNKVADADNLVAQYHPQNIRCCCTDSLNRTCCWIESNSGIGRPCYGINRFGCFCADR